jgi:pyruvate kinase
MNVARLNFSHGTHAEHRQTLETVRTLADELGIPVGILQDLQGPKIRTGPVEKPPIRLVPGAPFTITTLPYPGTDRMVSTTFSELPQDVHPGDCILLSDGAVELIVVSTTSTEVNCRVVRGGYIGSHTGINLPGAKISAPSLTEKDLQDLQFGLAMGVDFIALSFVRSAADVERAKQVVASAGFTTPVIAKLEKPEAITYLEEIIAVADGVMVARGDLGVEVSPAEVPLLQKRIIATASRHAIPVITATQMLESMVHNPRPTRAEASDVANAIFDGTDAVMLSAETAIGEYPVESVTAMARIAAEADAGFPTFGHREPPEIAHHLFSEAIAEATYAAARRIDAAAIVARTRTGFTARLVSKYRPSAPIVAVTDNPAIARQTTLLWGVVPTIVAKLGTLGDLVQQIDRGQFATDLIKPGDAVVLTASAPGVTNREGTNVMELHRISAR